MLKAATAVLDITPERGEDLCGFAARGGNRTTGVHDRLKSRWLSLEDEQSHVLVSATDLISVSRNFYRDLAEQVQAEYRKHRPSPVPEICLATSHTHSGPATMNLRRCGSVDRRYMGELRGRLEMAACAAGRGAVPVCVGVARTDAAGHSLNRRDPEKGAVDTEMLLVEFRREDQDTPLASLVNYACHPVVMGGGNLEVSADYPGYLQDTVERELPGTTCLFLNGACGDINPREAHHTDFGYAERMGTDLARTAVEARRDLTWLGDTAPRCRSIRADLPVFQPASAGEFDERMRAVTEAFQLPPQLFADRVENMKRELAAGVYPRRIALSITLLTIGEELAFVFIPGEVFAEIGLAIKQMSPYRFTAVCGFSNGTVGYLPTRDAYARGGYETSLANFFYGFPEFDPSLQDVLLEKVGVLFRQAVPA